MQPYLLLCLSILFASANNLLLHRFGNRALDSPGGVLLFNAAVSGIWVIILGGTAIVSGGLRFDAGSVCWGILYGVVTAAFLFFKMQAMATGPVSLTAFIGCASLLISTGFGVFVLGEGAGVLQTVGVAILMIALFLVVSPKNDHGEKSWKLWCSGFFTCSAAVGIIFKLHQRSGSASKINEMMFAAALTSVLLFTVMSFAVSEKHRPKPIPVTAVGYLIACGIAGCVYNRLNIFLAGQLPSVVFYPTFNGSVILISTLCGLIFFKEKLKARQAVGIAAGAAALMLASGTIDNLLKTI